MKKVLVCVTGSIAAYKAPNIVNMLIKEGFLVQVVMSQSACEFISPLVFESLTGKKVIKKTFDDPLAHIELGKECDVVLVVPATYNIIGKVASGVADDIVSLIISATKAPVMFALAMNTNMYENPILLKNIDFLKSLGKYKFINPQIGILACGDYGYGKLLEEYKIVEIVKDYFLSLEFNLEKLKNKKILITSGSTKEYLDPIRFMTNGSSGKMGRALAKYAHLAGASVTFVSAALNKLDQLEGIKNINVISAKDMYEECLKISNNHDIVIGAAAVGDYSFSKRYAHKLKKEDKTSVLSLEMLENKDILKEIGKDKGSKIIVGFCLETDNILDNAIKKIKAKNLDFIVANGIDNLSSDSGSFNIIDQNEKMTTFECNKNNMANHILQKICCLLN
jgi:phosphopantothenoylcysteine decarboxylase/phosphopantothenate--cysteine ligase